MMIFVTTSQWAHRELSYFGARRLGYDGGKMIPSDGHGRCYWQAENADQARRATGIDFTVGGPFEGTIREAGEAPVDGEIVVIDFSGVSRGVVFDSDDRATVARQESMGPVGYC